MKQYIDSHQHFWQISRGDYGWLTPETKTLYRDFLPEDLRPELSKTEIQSTILVQATDTELETDYLLSLAEQTDFVAGVVGWINMEDDKAEDKIRSLSQNHYFKGIRPMIQDIEDVNWMLRSELTPVFETLIELNLSFDALVLPQHLNNLLKLLKQHPGLRAVIDHGAKPNIADPDRSLIPWQTKMKQLADETEVFCKFSGLVTEAGDKPSLMQLTPYTDYLLKIFGPERLMWGSDWPVVNLCMEYKDWADMTCTLLRNLSSEDKSKILGVTASNFYRLT